MRPAAYTLFGLTPPWLLEGGSDFKTSESGQILFNRCAPCSPPSISSHALRKTHQWLI